MSNARWATKKEILEKTEKTSIEKGIKRSGVPLLYENKYFYIDKHDTHNLLIGSTGSGKTQAVILPLINLSIIAKETIIVNDPNGELYKKMTPVMKDNGYDVYLLDFDDALKGNNWNPLKLAYDLYKTNKDKGIKMVEDLGYYLFTDIKERQMDPFWTNSTINYFTGVVLYLFENAKEEEIHLGSVQNLSNQITNSKDFLKKIDINSKIYLKLSGTLNAPPETKGSILSVFNQKLERFVSKENLENMLSSNDIALTSIDKKPTAIFLVSGLATYCNSLVPLFINQIVDSLNLSDNRDRKVNILLDEFDSMIPIKNFARILNYSRGLNIEITVTIQSVTHLLNMYSKEETEILSMCFGNIIYLLSEDIYTLEKISYRCGKIDNKGTPLISIEELKTLKPFEAIILHTRMMPFKTKMKPSYEIDWGYKKQEVNLPDRKTKPTKYYSLEK